MIEPAEWKALPLEVRLTEQASHLEGEDLLRTDLLGAVILIQRLRAKVIDLEAEVNRLERLSVTPYS